MYNKWKQWLVLSLLNSITKWMIVRLNKESANGPNWQICEINLRHYIKAMVVRVRLMLMLA